MVSVCMATYNGAKYLREQVDSILVQLDANDELIVSDDGSIDETLDIIGHYADSRVKIVLNKNKKGTPFNFENALKLAKGDYIFLADQDDVWLPGRVNKMITYMVDGYYDLVMCNCNLVDKNLNTIKSPHFDCKWPMKRFFLSNLYKNAFLGCCIVFNRKVLNATLPFPKNIVMHDLWIALFSQLNFKCGYMDEILLLYRRHENTVSFTGSRSTNPLLYKIKYREHLLRHLLWRSFEYIISSKKINL